MGDAWATDGDGSEGTGPLRRRALRVLGLLAAIPVVALIARPAAPPGQAARSDVPEGPVATDSPQPQAWERVETPALGGPGAQGISGVVESGSGLVAVGIGGRDGDGRTRPAVWRTADGVTWARIADAAIDDGGDRYADAGLLMHDVVAITPGPGGPERLMAVGYANFEPDQHPVAWISDDAGATWQVVHDAFPDEAGFVQAAAATANGVVAVGGTPSGRAGVWVSADGERWSPRHTDSAEAFTDVVADGQFVVVSDGSALWASTSGGRDWSAATLPDHHLGIDEIRAIPTGFMATGTHEGDAVVLHSTDGLDWGFAAPPVGRLAGEEHTSFSAVAEGEVGLVAGGQADGAAAVWEIRHGGSWTRIPLQPEPSGDSWVSSLARTEAGIVAVGGTGYDEDQDAAIWVPPSTRTVEAGVPGPVAVLSSDHSFTTIDLLTGEVERFSNQALAGGDPPLRLMADDHRLVFYGQGGDTYMTSLDDLTEAERLSASTYFLPSTDPGRVWLVHAEGSMDEAMVRPLTVSGRPLADWQGVPVTSVVGTVGDAVVLDLGMRLVMWRDWEAVDELVGRSLLAASDQHVVTCREPCDELVIASRDAGPRRIVPAPGGGHFGLRAAMSADGRLALWVFPDAGSASDGPRAHLVVVDLGGGTLTEHPTASRDASSTGGHLAWSPEGSLVCHLANADDLACLDLRDGFVRQYPAGLSGQAHGLAVVGSPGAQD